MRSDSPPPSWYEPRWTSYEDWELEDDTDDAPAEPEPLVIANGVVIWTATN